jgi:holo-[acyl-carrier protein] synthase
VVWGVGLDILHLDRIRCLGQNFDDAFFRKTFTASERALAATRDDPVAFYAGEFAAKEAVFKALRTNAVGLKWCDIEVLADGNSRPVVTLGGRIGEWAAQKGVNFIDVSISCDTDYASAFAVASIQ